MAWIRKSQDGQQQLMVAANLTPTPRSDYRIGVPKSGFYREIFNSDAEWYGGSGSGNQGGAYSSGTASHGFDHSISVFLPSLAVVVFRPMPPKDLSAGST